MAGMIVLEVRQFFFEFLENSENCYINFVLSIVTRVIDYNHLILGLVGFFMFFCKKREIDYRVFVFSIAFIMELL